MINDAASPALSAGTPPFAAFCTPTITKPNPGTMIFVVVSSYQDWELLKHLAR